MNLAEAKRSVLLALIFPEAGGEHGLRMQTIVAVFFRHIADWQGGNASPIAHALIQLSTLIHYPRGQEKNGLYSAAFFFLLTFHCVSKQSRRHAEKRAPEREFRDALRAR